MNLAPSSQEISQFLNAIFPYADQGTFISLRAFDQKDRGRPPVLIEGVRVNGDFAPIVARAAAAAGKAANGAASAVFAPPVATFNNATKARGQDVANGVALAVELDEGNPDAARRKLEHLLGPVTIAVQSGGEWTDPATGELHPKSHFYWRLAEPTRTPEDHDKLREARWLAAVLVGADRTAAPLAHPLRWPGSWNTKKAPKQARIAAGNAASEIHLEDALERLREAVEATGLQQQGVGPRVSGEAQAPIADVAAALACIPNAELHWDDWNRIGMATWRATGGAPEGLDAWQDWSAKSGKHEGMACAERWSHFATSPPSKIGAGTLFFLARAAGWQGRGRAPQEPPRASSKPEANPEHHDQRGDNAATGETEDDVALAFAGSNEGRLAFDHTDKQWVVWTDNRWKRDDTGRAFDMAREYVRGVREVTEKASLGKVSFIRAVEGAARHDRRIAVSHEVWDTDPWLIGVPGGYVNLRTGKLHEADPTLFISRQTLAAPAPEGTPAPVWLGFLNEATRGDKDLQAFLQRLAGYCLTGDVSEEVLSFIYGSGGNGKGVFVGTLTSILDEYAVSTPIEAFTANSHMNLEYYRAQMAGARLVTASETEAGAAWRESQIKEMTGNEAPLSARKPYGSPFTFRPQFKIAIVGNHAPMLRGRSPAMERRLRVVPFIHQPTNPDPYLKDKLKAEYPAILRWMIDGCLMWQRDRLGTTQAIQEATSSYFEAQDGFRRWLEEKCVLASHLRTPTGEAYGAFKSWCSANGEEAVKVQEFTEMVERHPDMKRVKIKGKATISGLGFIAETSGGRYGNDD